MQIMPCKSHSPLIVHATEFKAIWPTDAIMAPSIIRSACPAIPRVCASLHWSCRPRRAWPGILAAAATGLLSARPQSTSPFTGSWTASPSRHGRLLGHDPALTRGPRRASTVPCAAGGIEIDPVYPGTAVERLRNIHTRVKGLSSTDLSGDWQDVRRKLLWAGGLRDLPDARPGQGYTGHSFNDDNHCDLTPMLGDVAHNLHEGAIQGIAMGNRLGPGIEIASLPELGLGGSWSTCTNGCHLEPPQDVAHVQFRSRIAFKLVWCPPEFETFVLVDDEGNVLNRGSPSGTLPPMRYRMANYALVEGSKYAHAASAEGQQEV